MLGEKVISNMVVPVLCERLGAKYTGFGQDSFPYGFSRAGYGLVCQPLCS